MDTQVLAAGSGVPITEQLADRFARRIEAHLLPVGGRLPSVRRCAAQYGVSPATVVSAYDLLVARGLVVAMPQRGFFVRGVGAVVGRSKANAAIAVGNAGAGGPGGAARDLARATLPDRPTQSGASASDAAPPAARAMGAELLAQSQGLARGSSDLSVGGERAVEKRQWSAMALMRGMFHAPFGDGRAQPGMGVLPADWLSVPLLGQAVRRVVSARSMHESACDYGHPQGDESLRAALSQRLAAWSIDVSPQAIITTVGATQGLDIVCRTLLQPGDPVMVDEPGWAVEFARLKALGAQVLPVPRLPDGPDLGRVEHYCKLYGSRLKLFVCTSVLHNPTGGCLSPSCATRLLELAHRHGFWVAEDDTYAHLAPDHAVRMTALDGLRRTFHIGGFSKVLAPGWRVGYIAAPAEWVEPLLDVKLITTLTTPAIYERALAHCISAGALRRYALGVQRKLASARTASVRHALGLGLRFAAEPAGMFGWLDVGTDTDVLAPKLFDQDYLIATGSLFFSHNEPTTLMRVNFAATQSPAFWQALQKVLQQ